MRAESMELSKKDMTIEVVLHTKYSRSQKKTRNRSYRKMGNNKTKNAEKIMLVIDIVSHVSRKS